MGAPESNAAGADPAGMTMLDMQLICLATDGPNAVSRLHAATGAVLAASIWVGFIVRLNAHGGSDVAEQPTSSHRYVRMVAGFCGMILLAAGSALILGEILYKARQSGASSLTEFNGPALLALFAVTTSVLAVLILVAMARRMIRGRR